MSLLEELGAPWGDLVVVLVSAVAVYVLVIAYIRLAGLRSMSKMSSFDFVMTVAVGAIVGSVAVAGQNLSHGLVALGALFGAQVSLSVLRRRTRIGTVVDNDPLLLMAGADVIDDNMRRAHLTTAELHAKLREANVLNPSQIRAVVMETTGDVSVLHGDAELDPDLFTGVIGAERLRDADR